MNDFPSPSSDAHGVINPDFLRVVPEEKGLSVAYLAALMARGEVETFSGDELRRIGMPVGGLFCGTLYLGGDGRLWLWDIFNRGQEGIVPNTVFVGLQEVKSRDGSAFLAPPLAESHRAVEQGFALKVKTARGTIERTLDASGFDSVGFSGQYPLATIDYADAAVPVAVKLEAFSPFIPLDAESSSLPATIFSFQIHNTSDESLEIELAGRLENAVLCDHPGAPVERQQQIASGAGFTCWQGSARVLDGAGAREIENLSDFGSMSLLLLGEAAQIQDSASVGELGRTLALAPGETARVEFVLAWYFPNANDILGGRKRHYAARFAGAGEVAKYIAQNFVRLTEQTRLWRDTWNDSTLPHWFLNRTFANTSTLATTTCHRFDDGRFWAWEGVGCCPGTCTHVWHYAQAMARLFPEIERDQRQRVDFGLALQPEDGVIRFRAEDGATYAVDGQAGRILGAYREHQMAPDSDFLRRIWPGVRRALKCLIATDGNGDGILYGPLHNTLDADWFGVVPWICGLYHAALHAGAAMAREMGDAEFEAACEAITQGAAANLDAKCWSEAHGYYVHRGDPQHPGEVGAYDGCHIDQVLGQAWAHQVCLGQVMTPEHVRRALQSLWRFNFVPDIGSFRQQKTAGRWYASAGDAGLIMVSYPFESERTAEGEGAWSAMYFNECMSGFEHQVAAHMMWEGLVTEGLAVTRAIHDRYAPRLRNPYNEIECSDHYARALSSYGTFLAACGFEYHGPQGHLAFAPRLTPQDFRAAFTGNQGWGTFEQQFDAGTFRARVALKWGDLRLQTLGLQPPDNFAEGDWVVKIDEKLVETTSRSDGARLTIKFAAEVRLQAGQTLRVDFSSMSA